MDNDNCAKKIEFLKQLQSGHSQDPAVILGELVDEIKKNDKCLQTEDKLELAIGVMQQYEQGREGIDEEVKVIMQQLCSLGVEGDSGARRVYMACQGILLLNRGDTDIKTLASGLMLAMATLHPLVT
jgi:hypothetical protein